MFVAGLKSLTFEHLFFILKSVDNFMNKPFPVLRTIHKHVFNNKFIFDRVFSI